MEYGMKRYSHHRKYIALALLIIVGLLGNGCEDFLDQKPTDGLVRSEYWKNKEEVLATLAGAYKKLTLMDKTLFIHGEVRGDLLDAGSSLESAQEKMMESNIQSDNKYAQWGEFYSVINLCNHVIRLAPAVQELDQTFSDFLLQQYVAEATFLRSLSYFYLVRIFNDVPFVLEPSETDNADFFLPLSAADDILASVKADLIDIRNRIPSIYPSLEHSKTRASRGAVDALLADICLWNFEYADCIQYVEDVEQSDLYFLLPATEWFELFQPGFSLEGIFEIYYDNALGQPNSLYNITINRNNYLASEFAQTVLSVETLEAAEQVRGNGSISLTNRIWKYGGQFPDKETGRPAGSSASANFIVYRLADLYLMKAEAYSQLGNYDEALVYLNMVRLRANVDALRLSNDAQVFEDAILTERAKELAFEGKRWFDLLRMGRRNNYANKDKLIEILVQDVPSSQKLVQKAKLSNPMGWYMPIHIDEIERNRNITQNPYYYESN